MDEGEYHDAMIGMLELIWGEGFMAPGGAGNVARMVDGLELRDRLVVDVGCGLGGPALVLAREHGARVVGLDLEAPLLERARARARAEGLAGRVSFQQVEKGPLPFADASVDVVLSAGAYTQTEDKLGAFRDCRRVLRPGGSIRLYDWTRRDTELSEAMRYWIQVEGLTYALETLDRYAELLEQAGFVDVAVEDASDWYRRRVADEYEAMRGPLFPQMLERLGRESAEHFVENWRAMLRVCETGEMRQGYCRGRRP
jgi:ubiquinone/menaquinone biosynthesis C-methylase UbiE